MDDIKLIKKLLTRAEGEDLDFKSVPIVISNPQDKARFIKNLICMANTPRKGSAYIVSGVSCKPGGKKEIVGVSESEHPDDADLQELAKGKVDPPPQFSYRAVTYSGTSLGILEINPRKYGPFMPRFECQNIITQGPLYFRRGSSNAIATTVEMREIIAWMDTKETSPKHSKIIEATNIDVGGSLFDYPCFFPSISSLRTQVKPLGYLHIINASTYPFLCISAYDIYNDKDDQTQIGMQLKSARAKGKKVLLDCGYYESSWKDDKKWTEETFWDVLRNYEFDFAFCFDKQDENKASSEYSIVDDVVERWTKDRDVTEKGNIIPIIHTETEKFPQIVPQVAQKLNPVMVAIPERELGEGLIATARTIIKTREALNKTGAYFPIHLLGTGNPLSILIYTICGANSFDGLEWCQMVLNYDTALLHHTQHYDFFEGQSDFSSIPGFSRDLAALMHNLTFYLDWMKRIQQALASHSTIEFLEEYFRKYMRDEGYLEILKKKLPELFTRS